MGVGSFCSCFPHGVLIEWHGDDFLLRAPLDAFCPHRMKFLSPLFLLLSSSALAQVDHQVRINASNPSVTSTRVVYVRWQVYDPMTFEYVDFGYEPFTVSPGASSVITSVSPLPAFSSSSYSVTLYVDASGFQVEKIGSSLVQTLEGDLSYKRYIGSANVSEVGSTPISEYTINLRDPKTIDGLKPIWEVADETLTADLFREGVDKLFAGVSASASSGSGGADPAATSNREAVATAQIQANQLTDFSGLTPSASASAFAAAGASASDDVTSLFPAVISGLPFALPAMAAPDLTISLPAIMGGGVVDFNPFTPDRFGPMVAWFRAAVGWIALAHLCAWLWAELGTWSRAVSSSPQARGNAVVGGTGAQATSFAAAAIITVAILAAMTAFLGYAFDTYNPVSLLSGLTTSPFVDLASGSYWLLNTCFPIAILLSVLLVRATFSVFAVTIYAGVSAVIRFVTP